MSEHEQPSQPGSIIQRLGQYFAAWRRVSRVILSWLITLLAVSAITLPVLYWQIQQVDFAAGESPADAPLIAIVVLALAVYAFTWSGLVGFRAADRENWQPVRHTGWVILLGLLALVALLVEVGLWVSSAR